jgi:hypothetical protein
MPPNPSLTRERAAAGGTRVAVTAAREALVVFEDRTDARALRWLRPGFRHCFCLTGDDRRWTLFDPLKGRLAVAAVDGLPAAELAAHLATDGRHVLHGIVTDPGVPAWPGLRPLTCVEIVKRLVGLSAAAVVTPRQLHACLLRPAPGRPAYVELASAGSVRNQLI